MAILPFPDEVKEAYNSIRDGNGLQNPFAAVIEDLQTRLQAVRTTADAYPVDPNLTALIAAIDSLDPVLDDYIVHTDSLTRSDEPPEGAAPYGFKTRVGILQGVLNIVESGFDNSDPDTAEDKKQKIFGSVLTIPNAELETLEIATAALEAAVGAIALSAEAVIQNPVLASVESNLTGSIGNENGNLEDEIQRLKDLGTAGSLFALKNDPLFSDLLDNVLSTELKDDLGFTP